MPGVNTNINNHFAIIQSNKIQVSSKMVQWMQNQPNWSKAPADYKAELLGIIEIANSDKSVVEFEELTRNQKEFIERVNGQYLTGKLDFLGHEKLDY